MSAVANPRSTRYPAKVHVFARKLHEQGGTVAEIQAALAKRGYHPSDGAVRRWIDPDVHEAYKVNHRMRYRSHPREMKTAWWAKRKRMRELRSIGLSCLDVARVMNHDYGMKLNRDQVRALLGEDSKPVKRPQFVIERASA